MEGDIISCVLFIAPSAPFSFLFDAHDIPLCSLLLFDIGSETAHIAHKLPNVRSVYDLRGIVCVPIGSFYLRTGV